MVDKPAKPELNIIGRKPRVAFVCVHNSCRSQIAEALGRLYASDVFDSYSAGTELKGRINPDAARLVKKLYGIDMEQSQYSKLLDSIPEADVIVYMGCDASCPNAKARYSEDWGLSDPTGKSDDDFMETISQIQAKILELKSKLE
ncbi:MAG: arsenate reductase ArsC [Eubacteriaceae bacterium]|nr:arsenate reductase ArsC [Eubacteriaceae bacterium]